MFLCMHGKADWFNQVSIKVYNLFKEWPMIIKTIVDISSRPIYFETGANIIEILIEEPLEGLLTSLLDA